MNVTSRVSRQAGFTLFELAIVLVIIGTLAGGGLAMFMAWLDNKAEDVTRARMAAIQQTLLDYRRAQERIPCPADITQAQTAANFGVEASTTGDCYSTGTIKANFRDGSNTNAVAGSVPVKTLRLPDEYAFDGWGRRILYAVDKRFTASGGFTSNDIASTGIFVMKDASATTFANPVYVLVSFGSNGHGAYLRSGGATRMSAQSVNTGELENCDCTSAGVSGTFNNIFIQKPYTANTANSLDSFDDIVYFQQRRDLLGWTE
jgi:prepilin-type N-terminal cleavage/methylation domain-containing protein